MLSLTTVLKGGLGNWLGIRRGCFATINPKSFIKSARILGDVRRPGWASRARQMLGVPGSLEKTCVARLITALSPRVSLSPSRFARRGVDDGLREEREKIVEDKYAITEMGNGGTL